MSHQSPVKTCFDKHATTKASTNFGQGLTATGMALERLEAFMTLRTGRVSLYQEFSADRGLDHVRLIPQLRLIDDPGCGLFNIVVKDVADAPTGSR